jgi:hypothetical protein
VAIGPDGVNAGEGLGSIQSGAGCCMGMLATMALTRRAPPTPGGGKSTDLLGCDPLCVWITAKGVIQGPSSLVLFRVAACVLAAGNTITVHERVGSAAHGTSYGSNRARACCECCEEVDAGDRW